MARCDRQPSSRSACSNAFKRSVAPTASAVASLPRGLAGGTANSDGLRQQARAGDVLAAVDAHAVAPVRQPQLGFFDVLQALAVYLDLCQTHVVFPLRFGLIGVGHN